jgi:hypothetical protein
MIDRLCHHALRYSCLSGLCARSARSTPRGRTSVPDNIGQSQSRQASMSPAKSKLARVYQRSHPLAGSCCCCQPAAAEISFACKLHPSAHHDLGRRASGDRLCLTFPAAAWRSPDAKAQIDYQIDSQQEAWHLPGDEHGLRRPAAGPRESPATRYGLTAWLLCSLRLLAGRRHRPLSKACRDRSHRALHSRCRHVPALHCTIQYLGTRDQFRTSECSCCRRP